MQHTTDMQPAADARHADRGTGTKSKPSTLARDESRLAQHLHAVVAYFAASEARWRAEAAEHRAMAAVHRCDPLVRSVDRALLIAACEGQANEAGDRAAYSAKNLALFRAKLPAMPPKMVEIVLTIEPDAFRESVTVDRLGAPVTRTWERLGTGVWRCRDPRWHDAERSLGVDLCTYLEYLPLPDDVLDAMAALVRASDAAEVASHG